VIEAVMRITLSLALLTATALAPVQVNGRPLEDFFGQYAGRTISTTSEGLSERDLNVNIRSAKKGFTLQWTTVIREAGETRHRGYTIDFQPSNRKGIYGSAMRSDKFGGKEPLDPLKGEPYVWARVREDTLTVYSLVITDTGGYEIQVFDRELTSDGMRLTFSRTRDGEQLKVINGTLERLRN
jgi:hypothetical protein